MIRDFEWLHNWKFPTWAPIGPAIYTRRVNLTCREQDGGDRNDPRL